MNKKINMINIQRTDDLPFFVAQHEQKYKLKEEKKLYIDGSIVSMRTQIIFFSCAFGGHSTFMFQ